MGQRREVVAGEPFGRYRAVEEVEPDRSGQRQVLVACTCPAKTRKVVRLAHLTGGRVVSCGCRKQGPPVPLGEQRGRLTAIAEVEPDAKGRRMIRVECACEAKTRKVVRLSGWLSGHRVSCGCYRREQAALHRPDPAGWTTHGASGTPEYGAWASMKQRCYYPGYKGFDRYGGRGIKVCDRWRHSFANFLADMGPRPSPAHSLHRGDGDGDYDPATNTIVWATGATQNRFRQNVPTLTWNGETRPVPEWAERRGLPLSTLKGRLREGWSVERALLTPHQRPPVRRGSAGPGAGAP